MGATVLFLAGDRRLPAQVVRHSVLSRRLRLEVPGLRGNVHLARRLVRVTESWPGVVRVRAAPSSGRMLLEYAENAPLLGRLKEAPEPRRPVATPGEGGEPWHALEFSEVLRRLRTDRHGLSEAEAQRRLKQDGPNVDELFQPRSRLAILSGQVLTLPMGLLLGSAGLSVALGDQLEAAAILVVVGVDVGIGYRIERKNEELLASFRKVEAGTTQVFRDHSIVEISTRELVRGDVVVLRAGDVVPADARVIESHRLSLDESALTGESEPIQVHADPVPPDAPLGDRHSMIYSGTTVVSGHGRAVVVATGANTEFARIRALVERGETPVTPLTRKLERLDRKVAGISVAAAAGSAVLGLARGRPGLRVLRDAVALGVAALPEGLPLVATASLVRAMQRLHARGMVVRRVSAGEALGGVTVICTDKTGTLTQNRMELQALRLPSGDLDLQRFRASPDRVFDDPGTLAFATALLNSEVEVHRNGHGLELAGSGTERALIEAGIAAGIDFVQLRQRFPKVRLQGRTVGVPYVRSVHRRPGGGWVSFMKGAPEQVMAMCARTLEGELDPEQRTALAAQAEALAADGLRVLALAFRTDEGVEPPRSEGDGHGYTFIGFVGLRELLRPGAAASISLARRAGVRTVMVTGDHPRTAEALAKQVGLDGRTLVASELRTDGADLSDVAVFARVTPEDKLNLVRALRQRGEIVAMIGDGVNDAPALKSADIGVALAHGTEMARQVADVVLAREDLRAIIAGVGEGRIVLDNLHRAIRYLFATNLSEMAMVVGASILGAAQPLTPLQLLWINLLTDTFPGLALALEPGDPEVLDRPPAPPDKPLLDRAGVRRLFRDGLVMAGLGGVGMVLGGAPLAFSTLIGAQLGYAQVCRAPQHLNGLSRGSDGLFVQVMAAVGLVQLTALLTPPVRSLLGVAGLSPPALVGGFAAGWLAPLVLLRPRRRSLRVLRTVSPEAAR